MTGVADLIAEANALLREKGYKETHLSVHPSSLPGRALLKGSRMLSPFADSPETVLAAVRRCVPPAEALGGRSLTPHELRACLGRR